MKNQNQKKKETTRFQKFLRFSGIGVQLGVLMYLASLLGAKIDTYYTLEKPWFTLLFILVALIIFVINLMRQLEKLNK